MRRSKTLAKLRAGKVALGGNISLGPSVIVAGLAGKLGMDFTWIDMEHRWFTFQDAALMIYGCRETDVDPMIRVPGISAQDFHRCFELGATGVMMPHCRSIADAHHAVDCSKFPPLGRRSKDNVLVDGDFGLADPKEFIDWHNRETFVTVQIEDTEAVEAVDQIIATPGVDILFIGPGDLSQSYNKPGEFDAPEMKRAYRRVDDACKKHKKWWGLPTGPSTEQVARFADMGATFLVPFVDYSAVLTSWQREVETVRNTLAKNGLA